MKKEKSEVDSNVDECAWYHRIRGIFGDNESHSRRDWAIASTVFVAAWVGLYLFLYGAWRLLERIFGV